MNSNHSLAGRASSPDEHRAFASIRRRSIAIRIIAGIALVAGVLAALAATAGFFDKDPVHLYGMNSGRHPRFVAVYLSGDTGLRFGMGSYVAPALAAQNIPVYGISMPAVFARQRSQADVDHFIADTTRQAFARSGADRAILIGQSFGSDILAAGLEGLPPDLRARVPAVVLVVPGRTAFFRADPTGLRYHGTPDANLVSHVKSAGWASLICIYGQRETDSLCPALLGSSARVIELPGGHLLHRDHDKLIATIFNALSPVFRRYQERRK